jgi:hypothetical protein
MFGWEALAEQVGFEPTNAFLEFAFEISREFGETSGPKPEQRMSQP